MNLLEQNRKEELIQTYRDGVLNDTLPFWLNHCIDREHGGFLFSLDRDGTVLSFDKPMWLHGRFIWLLSTLYGTIEAKSEWLETAKHGLNVLRRYGFDEDGRMFFLLDRQGQPLRKRRYLFTEAFGVAALAAYAKAAQDEQAAQEAVDLFEPLIRYHTTPGLLESKVIPQTRQTKGLAMPMILIATTQILRDTAAESLCNEWIDHSIAEVERDFMKEEFRAVLESVGTNGELVDTFEGRMICPGHSIECNGLLSLGAFRAIRDKGLRIPKDIGFASFDETVWTPLVDPPITVIQQPTYEIGQTAIELLLKRIEEHSRPTSEVILKSKLVVRQSCGCGK